MKKAFLRTSVLLATFTLPLISSAAINSTSGVGSFVINTINNVLLPVLFAVAFIVFIWGAFRTFIMGVNSEEVKENGKNLMLYGLIGFFIIVAIWGLVNVFGGGISFGNNS